MVEVSRKRSFAGAFSAALAAGDTAKKSPGPNKPFQRVNVEEWMGKKGSHCNTYEAAFGEDGWGAGAERILGAVKGKDFRHEKTKKKRGGYKGGAIDMNASKSVKFADSDDD